MPFASVICRRIWLWKPATAGAQPMLVLTGKGKKTRAAGGLPEGTLVFADLAEAVRHIVA